MFLPDSVELLNLCVTLVSAIFAIAIMVPASTVSFIFGSPLAFLSCD